MFSLPERIQTDERLKVTQKTETLLDVPMLKVSQVVVFGRVTVTAPTLQALLEHHIPVCYLSAHGRYVGRIEPALSKNALLRSAQYRAAFNAISTLALARQIGPWQADEYASALATCQPRYRRPSRHAGH